jgi:hypothetical protein
MADQPLSGTLAYVRTPEKHRLTLRQADRTRSDFATIESDLEFIAGQLPRLPTPGDLAKLRSALSLPR